MKNKKVNVKGHKRYDPRLGKKVDVGSYDRNQRFNQYKKLSNSQKTSQLKCFYCGDNVSIEELLQSDQTLGDMEGEDREFLTDSFPKTKNPRKAPFVHKSDLGYDVLNICKSCFKKAYNKLFEENSD